MSAGGTAMLGNYRARVFAAAFAACSTTALAVAATHCSTPADTPPAADAADGGVLDATRKDAGIRDTSVGEADLGDVVDTRPAVLGCTPRAGWTTVNPLRPSCAMQMAPPSEWAAAALPMLPCPNGQVNCTQMAIPLKAGGGIVDFTAPPVGSETNAFTLRYNGDQNLTFEACRTSLNILPNPSGYTITGATQINYNSLCQAVPADANGDFAIVGTLADKLGIVAEVQLTPWDAYRPTVTRKPQQQFGLPFRTGNKLFMMDYNVEVIDIPTGALKSNIPVPPGTQQWAPEFAALGSIWGTALYGTLGKGEIWRIGADGVAVAMRQDPNVHMFAIATDGTTLFWAQGSGNEASWQNQPKFELWAATASTDPAIVASTARRLADVSRPSGNTLHGAAHNGYYAVDVGLYEVAVVRGRDGALQRIPLIGGWASPVPAYADEHQVWFGHPALRPTEAGFARIQLAAWPP
jgi:hypothetical protein